MNISNVLTTSTQKDPGRPAIVCDNESISYGELDRYQYGVAGEEVVVPVHALAAY